MWWAWELNHLSLIYIKGICNSRTTSEVDGFLHAIWWVKFSVQKVCVFNMLWNLSINHYHHHHTVQVTILHPITTATTTTTAQAALHAFSICTTALRKKTTTSASYCVPGPAQAPFRGSEAASPLLACTMQQAHVTCIRACHWITAHTPNSMACPYANLHVLAASCTPTMVMQVLTICNLCWRALSSTIEHMGTLSHMWLFEGAGAGPGAQ